MTPLEMYPRGSRWPWYPRFVATCTMGTPTTNGLGETTVGLTIVGDVKRGRIGLRRWLKLKLRWRAA